MNVNIRFAGLKKNVIYYLRDVYMIVTIFLTRVLNAMFSSRSTTTHICFSDTLIYVISRIIIGKVSAHL